MNRLMPSVVREKYDSLPPVSQNNSRSIFRKDWNWAKGSETREARFAEKWGFHYDGKYAQADHNRPEMKDRAAGLKDWGELEPEVVSELIANNIF